MRNVHRPCAWTAAAALAASLGLAACERDGTHVGRDLGKSNAPEASAQVIGKAPAAPTGDPPGTTPVSPGTTEISKDSETKTMPHEGDDHAYSSVSAQNPQKSGGVDPQQAPERKSP